MKTESLFQVLGLGLRAAEVFFARRGSPNAKPETRADRVVARVIPATRRALERVAPAVREAAPGRRRRRRASVLGLASSTVLGAAAAGAAAYIVTRQQQRTRDRYQRVQAAFRVELLDVLSAPGGAGRLEYSGSRLTDPHSGAAYNVVDGIPDFIAPPSAAGEEWEVQLAWADDLVRPYAMHLLGRNSTGNAAFASAAAAAAGTGWVLSVPSGRGIYELEMARANPRAHVLCVGSDWDALLETRRRALEAGLSNLYFARGMPRLLPLRDNSMAGVWTAGGLDRFPEPERELTQMVRAARRGALMAGVSLVRGGANVYDVVLQFGAQRLPGTRSQVAHFALLQAAGLQDVRLFRDGAFVRFTGVKG